jgi:hypothetical protein
MSRVELQALGKRLREARDPSRRVASLTPTTPTNPLNQKGFD